MKYAAIRFYKSGPTFKSIAVTIFGLHIGRVKDTPQYYGNEIIIGGVKLQQFSQN